MKKLLKRIFLKRMPEADLNAECAKAAAAFYQQEGKKYPLDEQFKINNYVAIGFGMGIRYMEKEMGAVNENGK